MSSDILNVKDVAAYILSAFDRPISTMKLQKLMYFSQGWALALLGRRLVATEFQAWKWGPVSYELYDIHRKEYEIREIPEGKPSLVAGNNKVIIDSVINNYGGLSGMQLGDLTHEADTPWTQVRLAQGITEERAPSNIKIPDKLISEYFQSKFERAQ